MPNPQKGGRLELRVELENGADSIGIKVYTKAMILVQSQRFAGNWNSGWNKVVIDVNPAEMNSGLYYLVATGHLNSGESAGCKMIGKLYYLQ